MFDIDKAFDWMEKEAPKYMDSEGVVDSDALVKAYAEYIDEPGLVEELGHPIYGVAANITAWYLYGDS